MKRQNRKITEKSDVSDVNPVCKVMASQERGRLILAQEDMETLRQLAQNPPLPTPNLTKTLRQNQKGKTRPDKSIVP